MSHAKDSFTSHIAGAFAHRGCAPSNAPSAPFWMQLALNNLRDAARDIERAEEREPRSTGLAHDHVCRAIAELEAVFPRAHVGNGHAVEALAEADEEGDLMREIARGSV